MKSSQNLRIARTGHKTAKSGVFSLKSDFGGRGTPQAAHYSKFPEIFWNFRSSHTLRHWFRVYFACVQCQNVPECVSALLAVISEQFTAWLHPQTGFENFDLSLFGLVKFNTLMPLAFLVGSRIINKLKNLRRNIRRGRCESALISTLGKRV